MLENAFTEVFNLYILNDVLVPVSSAVQIFLFKLKKMYKVHLNFFIIFIGVSTVHVFGGTVGSMLLH